MAVDPGPETTPLLVRACRGERVERTPVWAMRQAGRWDPEFRRIRGGMGFYEFAENPELAAAASLCPRRFGVDAIILFYDITTLAVAMGQSFELVANRGPVPARPIRSTADVRKLAGHPEPASYRAVLETLRLVREEVGDLPVLAFAGAPFTMAAYQTGVGKDMAQARTFIREQAEVWSALLEKTATATVEFLGSLLEAGATAYQLFDSWAGFLTRDEYRRYADPYHQRIFGETGGLSILFVKECPYVDLMAGSGCRVVSLGKTHDLRAMSAGYPDLIFQGNVDHSLLVIGTQAEVRGATRACLDAGGGHRHVLNLDHGMAPQAKVENFAAFVGEALK